MREINIGNLMRISKRRARRLYDEGKSIILCPVKCDPTNAYYPMSFKISLDDKFDVEPLDWEKEFDSRVNRFEYYNCQYSELGKYSAFYVEV